jgi:hypothetical protein
MSKRCQIGDLIHVNARDGGGQMYTIVGVNDKYLFLSYEIMYGYASSSANISVIERDNPRITSNPEKHNCN